MHSIRAPMRQDFAYPSAMLMGERTKSRETTSGAPQFQVSEYF